MIFSLAISTEVESDIDEAFLWYEFQQVGLGERFILFIDKGHDIITKMPESFPEEFNNIRKFVMEKFPYNIYCRSSNSKIVFNQILATTETTNFAKLKSD